MRNTAAVILSDYAIPHRGKVIALFSRLGLESAAIKFNIIAGNILRTISKNVLIKYKIA